MSSVAGVDGGATRSRGVLLDDGGDEAATVEGPPAPVGPGEVGSAADAIEGLVRELAEAAGAEVPLAALWCGLAGAGREGVRRAAFRAIDERRLARRVEVGTDADAALRDAFAPEEAGVLLAAGTGSIAVARSGEGGRYRVGGWGALLGDEGSGYRIGLDALRAVLRAHDGRAPETSLRSPILAAAEVDEPPELVQRTAGWEKPLIAALAPLVIEAAAEGDATAAAIVDEAARALTDHVRAAVTRRDGNAEAATVALAGGLLDPGGPLRARVEEALLDEGFEVVEREVRPARGAALLARELSGV